MANGTESQGVTPSAVASTRNVAAAVPARSSPLTMRSEAISVVPLRFAHRADEVCLTVEDPSGRRFGNLLQLILGCVAKEDGVDGNNAGRTLIQAVPDVGE